MIFAFVVSSDSKKFCKAAYSQSNTCFNKEWAKHPRRERFGCMAGPGRYGWLCSGNHCWNHYWKGTPWGMTYYVYLTSYCHLIAWSITMVLYNHGVIKSWQKWSEEKWQPIIPLFVIWAFHSFNGDTSSRPRFKS